MSNKKILILPGDGIGNEVMAEVLKIIDWMEKTKSMSFDISERLVGGAAYDKEGNSISDETMQIVLLLKYPIRVIIKYHETKTSKK